MARATQSVARCCRSHASPGRSASRRWVSSSPMAIRRGGARTRLAGADFQFRDSNFLPGKILQSDFFYQRSFSDTKGDDNSFGVAVNYPNEPLGLDTRFKQVGTNFFPALGFVNRTGIRQFDGHCAISPARSSAGVGSTSPRPGISSPISATIWSRARTESGPESIFDRPIKSISKPSMTTRTYPRRSRWPARFLYRPADITGPTAISIIQTSNARAVSGRTRCAVLQLLQRGLSKGRSQNRYPAQRDIPARAALHLHLYRAFQAAC